MKIRLMAELSRHLLLLLFVYAGLSKLLDWRDFAYQLQIQPLPKWSVPILQWGIPCLEVIICVLLLTKPLRLLGLYSSLLLLTLFTGYIGLVLAKAFHYIPCSCGGILSNMGWGVHLVFNVLFMLIAGMGIYAYRKPDAKYTGNQKTSVT